MPEPVESKDQANDPTAAAAAGGGGASPVKTLEEVIVSYIDSDPNDYVLKIALHAMRYILIHKQDLNYQCEDPQIVLQFALSYKKYIADNTVDDEPFLLGIKPAIEYFSSRIPSFLQHASVKKIAETVERAYTSHECTEREKIDGFDVSLNKLWKEIERQSKRKIEDLNKTDGLGKVVKKEELRKYLFAEPDFALAIRKMIGFMKWTPNAFNSNKKQYTKGMDYLAVQQVLNEAIAQNHEPSQKVHSMWGQINAAWGCRHQPDVFYGDKVPDEISASIEGLPKEAHEVLCVSLETDAIPLTFYQPLPEELPDRLSLGYLMLEWAHAESKLSWFNLGGVRCPELVHQYLMAIRALLIGTGLAEVVIEEANKEILYDKLKEVLTRVFQDTLPGILNVKALLDLSFIPLIDKLFIPVLFTITNFLTESPANSSLVILTQPARILLNAEKENAIDAEKWKALCNLIKAQGAIDDAQLQELQAYTHHKVDFLQRLYKLFGGNDSKMDWHLPYHKIRKVLENNRAKNDSGASAKTLAIVDSPEFNVILQSSWDSRKFNGIDIPPNMKSVIRTFLLSHVTRSAEVSRQLNKLRDNRVKLKQQFSAWIEHKNDMIKHAKQFVVALQKKASELKANVSHVSNVLGEVGFFSTDPDLDIQRNIAYMQFQNVWLHINTFYNRELSVIKDLIEKIESNEQLSVKDYHSDITLATLFALLQPIQYMLTLVGEINASYVRMQLQLEEQEERAIFSTWRKGLKQGLAVIESWCNEQAEKLKTLFANLLTCDSELSKAMLSDFKKRIADEAGGYVVPECILNASSDTVKEQLSAIPAALNKQLVAAITQWQEQADSFQPASMTRAFSQLGGEQSRMGERVRAYSVSLCGGRAGANTPRDRVQTMQPVGKKAGGSVRPGSVS